MVSILSVSCIEESSHYSNSHYKTKVTDTKPSLNFLKTCTGSTALDLFAATAGAGPESPLNSNQKNKAAMYFSGQILDANVVDKTATKEQSFDFIPGDIRYDFKHTPDLNRFYNETVPNVYFSMCHMQPIALKNMKNDFFLLSANNHSISKRWADYKYITTTLFKWEVQLYEFKRLDDVEGIKGLMEELDAFLYSDSGYKEIIDVPSNFYIHETHINILKVAVFHAYLRSVYAIQAKSPIDMHMAIQQFTKIRAITTSPQSLERGLERLPLFGRTHWSLFNAYRYTATVNELHFLQLITDVLRYHPDWLQSPDEELANYAERIMKTRESTYSGTNSCPLPTKEELKILMAEKAAILMCKTPVELLQGSLRSLTVKVYESSELLDKIMLYQDSPFMWARHQYLQHEYYYLKQNIIERYQLYKHQSKRKTFEQERKCKSVTALKFARHVIPTVQAIGDIRGYCE